MVGITPRDVYLGAVAGGTLIGLALAAIGVLNLMGSYGFTSTQWQDAVVGATFFAVGSAFVLVSLIVLPAIRAIHLETGAAPR